jgi:hypothetical protein
MTAIGVQVGAPSIPPSTRRFYLDRGGIGAEIGNRTEGVLVGGHLR